MEVEKIAAAPDDPFFPALSPGAEDDNARLQRAILGLHKATLNQHAQVKKFRRVMLDFAEKISKLEQSYSRYDQNIRRIRLDPLNKAAKALSETMDTFLAKVSSEKN
ncbi:MAG: hypothetical protein V3R37_09115 [Rhodospirillales bacterium]